MFSGDTDGTITALGSDKQIKKLKWNVVKPWVGWAQGDKVKGFIEFYESSFDFATFRGVVRMVP